MTISRSRRGDHSGHKSAVIAILREDCRSATRSPCNDECSSRRKYTADPSTLKTTFHDDSAAQAALQLPITIKIDVPVNHTEALRASIVAALAELNEFPEEFLSEDQNSRPRPEHLGYEIGRYLEAFPRVQLRSGYALDYCFYKRMHGGLPLIFTRRIDEPRLSADELLRPAERLIPPNPAVLIVPGLLRSRIPLRFEHRSALAKLIRSYTLEAGQVESDRCLPSPDTVEAFIRDIARAHVEEYPALGRGQDVRLESRSINGAGLVVDDQLVHLYAFSAT